MPWLARHAGARRGGGGGVRATRCSTPGAQSVAHRQPRAPARASLRRCDRRRAMPRCSSAARAAGRASPRPRFSAQRLEDQDWVRAQPGAVRAARDRRGSGSARAGTSRRRRARDRALDPGPRFRHREPSRRTQLVLRFLERGIRGGERVLDYGCGSGILAIAAAKLGAAQRRRRRRRCRRRVEATAMNARLNRRRGASVRARSRCRRLLRSSCSRTSSPSRSIVLAPLLAARTARRRAHRARRNPRLAGRELSRRAYAEWFDADGSRRARTAGRWSPECGDEPCRRAARSAAPLFACSATQLAARGGRVRCGKCATVFDGVAGAGGGGR